MRNSVRGVILSCLLGVALITVPASSHAATNCPNPKADGKTVGQIQAGGVNVNVKNVTYPKGGQLNPPRSPLNAGVSLRHQPLSADMGTSVIVWHINLNGCQGKLNVINNKKVGYEFDVVDENGNSTTYAIGKKVVVPKGKYKADWFQLAGPRQLLLITCTGKIVNRSYKDNLVIFAYPVIAEEETVQP